MVRWYIFDSGTFLISLRIQECLSLPYVGSTYLLLMAWCGVLGELAVLISSTQPFVFQRYGIFLEGRSLLLLSCLPRCNTLVFRRVRKVAKSDC
jgi:hypothetical protein